MVGDFNIVADQSEKTGGCPVNMQDKNEFLSMMQQANLTNAAYHGNKHTWSNNRIGASAIVERLDRALLNCEWIAKFTTKVTHINKACSDHSPCYSQLCSPHLLLLASDS